MHFLLLVYKMWFQMAVGVWLRPRQKSLHVVHGKITKNRIAFKILSAVRLPWWIDAMVSLSVLMAVVLLWRFRLRVVPLSLSTSCVMHKKTSRKKFHASIFFLEVYLWSCESERGNTPSLMAILNFVNQKRFVGQGCLELPTLFCFLNQLRGERRLRKWKK